MWPWYGYWHPWGWGWHRRWWIPPYVWPWPSISREEDKAMLQEEAIILELELERIRNRLEKLKTQEVKNA